MSMDIRHAGLWLLLAGSCVTALQAQPSTQASDEPASLTTGRQYPTPLTKPLSPTDVLVTINDKPITRLMRDIYQKKKPNLTPDQALSELISQELLKQAALAAQLAQDPEAQAEIENQNRVILAGAAIQAYLAQHPITAEQIAQEYQQQNPQLTQTEYKAWHIISKTQAEAQALIEQLKTGADFKQLAREHSQGSSKASGGDIGWFNPQQMAKPFSDAVAALKPGQYTEKPVQTRFGWHIILLEQTRSIPAPPLKAVEGKLIRALQTKLVDAYIDELKQHAEIKTTEENNQ